MDRRHRGYWGGGRRYGCRNLVLYLRLIFFNNLRLVLLNVSVNYALWGLLIQAGHTPISGYAHNCKKGGYIRILINLHTRITFFYTVYYAGVLS